MKNYNKEKKEKSLYGKWINPILWLYGLSVCLCFVVGFIIIYSSSEEQIDTVGGICAIVMTVMVLAGSAAMIFLVLPLLKRKQAKLDFARYDFKPYTPT